MKHFRVAVLYGGESGEHEVSQVSAYWVLHNVDRSKYDPVAIGIDKSGHFWLTEKVEDIIDEDNKKLNVVGKTSKRIATPSRDDGLAVDVIFPAIHGPLYEDGHLQGALTLAGVAFVGAEQKTCAVAMDKVFSKQLAQALGVPIVPWELVHRSEYVADAQRTIQDNIVQLLGFPLIVKPTNLGSSVGVSYVATRDQLDKAITEVFRFDRRVLFEKAMSGHELEVAVLENSADPLNPKATLPGEIIPSEKYNFYSYESKYIDPNGADEVIPADVPEALQQQCQSYAKALFVGFDGCGMARIDFLYDNASETLYFNDFNPIPGFTPISFYPKLWQNMGLDYTSLVTELIQLALSNYERRQLLETDYFGS